MNHELRTDRLRLRPVTAEDQPWLLAHWSAPEVRHFFLDGAVLTPTEVTKIIDDSVRTFATDGRGLWLVHRTSTVGTAGLRPLDDLGIELTYTLAPDAWGNGYATEAATAVLDYALGTLGLHEVLAVIDEGNAASAAVIKRLGMTPFDVVPGLLGPMTRFRVTR